MSEDLNRVQVKGAGWNLKDPRRDVGSMGNYIMMDFLYGAHPIPAGR